MSEDGRTELEAELAAAQPAAQDNAIVVGRLAEPATPGDEVMETELGFEADAVDRAQRSGLPISGEEPVAPAEPPSTPAPAGEVAKEGEAQEPPPENRIGELERRLSRSEAQTDELRLSLGESLRALETLTGKEAGVPMAPTIPGMPVVPRIEVPADVSDYEGGMRELYRIAAQSNEAVQTLVQHVQTAEQKRQTEQENYRQDQLRSRYEQGFAELSARYPGANLSDTNEANKFWDVVTRGRVMPDALEDALAAVHRESGLAALRGAAPKTPPPATLVYEGGSANRAAGAGFKPLTPQEYFDLPTEAERDAYDRKQVAHAKANAQRLLQTGIDLGRGVH